MGLKTIELKFWEDQHVVIQKPQNNDDFNPIYFSCFYNQKRKRNVFLTKEASSVSSQIVQLKKAKEYIAEWITDTVNTTAIQRMGSTV